MVDELDQFVIHQVSKVHTAAPSSKAFGIDPKKVHDHLRRARQHRPGLGADRAEQAASELGRLKKGDRIALLGIGSGLNCSMAEVEW